MKRALLVHNENAGTDPVARRDIERVLADAGFAIEYCPHGEMDIAPFLEQPHDLIVAAGGDGTVADVVSTLERVQVPIGILPLGGSNNIANGLGVDADWRTIPARWDLGRYRPLDRCEADGPWGVKTFIEALGSGILTDAVEEADEEPETPEDKEREGRASFRRALCAAKPFHCAIDAGAWRWEGECLMVEVLNMPFVGSRLGLAPAAQPDDGLLDILVVTEDQRDLLHGWALDPDGAPMPLPTRAAARLDLSVHERPFRVDDRSPNEDLDGTVEVRIRGQQAKILTLSERM